MQRPLPWLRRSPVARVDYIWQTSELTAEAARTGLDAGSDYLPVIARLVLAPVR